MKISILSSAHKHNDDRVFYHFAKVLSAKGHLVNIVTSDTDKEVTGKISFSSFSDLNFTKKEKVRIYIKKLSNFDPDTIICLEPITIVAAKKYSKNKNIEIIYDITEWYPSKSMLKNHLFIMKYFNFFLYFFLFIYSCSLADKYIYGEYYKGIIPKKLFPKKKSIQISYYPKKEYIKSEKPNIHSNSLRLCYTGTLSIEKGLIHFLDILQELIRNNKKLHINVKLIGEFNPLEKEKCIKAINKVDKNIHFSFYGFQELIKYIQLINDTDIFLDLRSIDFVNSYSLPIKLFYFMALQRPVIYSDLKAIRKEVETKDFGYLVNPEDSKKIAELINNYQNNKTLYISHCNNAKGLFDQKYNWEMQEEIFISFIEDFKSEIV